jgi:hypothetical protein
MCSATLHPCFVLQVGDVLDQCSAVVLKAGKEGQYEREGYGQRPYDNWETVMIDCNGRVSSKLLLRSYAKLQAVCIRKRHACSRLCSSVCEDFEDRTGFSSTALAGTV